MLETFPLRLGVQSTKVAHSSNTYKQVFFHQVLSILGGHSDIFLIDPSNYLSLL
jgi:hypothetical protein